VTCTGVKLRHQLGRERGRDARECNALTCNDARRTGGRISGVGEHQIKVDANEEYWRRFQSAKAAGRLTNPSGLAKVALSHAMEHGQPATEALLDGLGCQLHVN
jgi:hypothetical protein